MRRSIRTVIFAAACLAVAPAAAHAATPFTAGSGAAPTVAVRSDGTGHVVWETTGDNVEVGYCRISPGGSACNPTEMLDFAGSTEANRGSHIAQVFTPFPDKVVIIAGCWNCPSGVQDRTYRWVSTNNGTSFSAPSEWGNGPETAGYGTWIEEAGNYVGVSGPYVKAAFTDG